MLLGRYQMLDAVALSDTLQVAYIELLLAQPEIIAQFTPPEQRELLTTMLQHHEQREQLIDTYSMTTFQTSTLLVGRMLHHNAVFNPIDPRVEQFLRDTTYDDEYDLRAVSHIVFDEAACQIATLK